MANMIRDKDFIDAKGEVHVSQWHNIAYRLTIIGTQ